MSVPPTCIDPPGPRPGHAELTVRSAKLVWTGDCRVSLMQYGCLNRNQSGEGRVPSKMMAVRVRHAESEEAETMHGPVRWRERSFEARMPAWPTGPAAGIRLLISRVGRSGRPANGLGRNAR